MKLFSRFVFVYSLLGGTALAQPAEPMRASWRANRDRTSWVKVLSCGFWLSAPQIGRGLNYPGFRRRSLAERKRHQADHIDPHRPDGGAAASFRNRAARRALRPGTLEVPSITVTAQDRTAHSQPMRLQVQSVPHAGRPAEFLGGVGSFALTAEVVPRVVAPARNSNTGSR